MACDTLRAQAQKAAFGIDAPLFAIVQRVHDAERECVRL
jgi:hypothetical protein